MQNYKRGNDVALVNPKYFNFTPHYIVQPPQATLSKMNFIIKLTYLFGLIFTKISQGQPTEEQNEVKALVSLEADNNVDRASLQKRDSIEYEIFERGGTSPFSLDMWVLY